MAENDRFHIALEKMISGWSDFFSHAFTALDLNGITGDYVEFGALSGTTLWLAHNEIVDADVERHLWTFDSFEGYPETTDPRDDHPSFKGSVDDGGLEAFLDACDGRGMSRDAYTAVEGYYEDTLPPLGTDGPPVDIALAYIDCNLYTSTTTVLEFLAPRLKHGMIVAFDDWFCWSDSRVSGERIALDEFRVEHPEWNFHRFKDIHWAGLSFVVEHAGQLTRPETGD